MKRYFILIALILLTNACNPANLETSPTPAAAPASTFTAIPAFVSTSDGILSTHTPTSPPTSTSEPGVTPQPTLSAAATASPTAIVTLEPKPATELSDTILPGKIFVWSIPFYGYLDPNQRFQELITRVGVEFPQEETPEKAITVAFSYYTQQIAYLLETEDQKVNLWLADLELQNPGSAWTDDENLSGYSPGDIWLWIRWGPGDQFVLLENISLSGPSEGDYFWVVYALSSKIVTPLTGPCAHLFISPQSGEFAAGCPTSASGFVVLEQDGTQWNMSELPQDSILAKDWVFSPDGSKVLYANEQDEIFIVGQAGQQIKLAIGYQWGSAGFVMQVLQWSQNGSRLLIFGNDATHCPYSTFAGRTPPCWQVFDPTTGGVIWHENDASGLTAAISPDGQWVVMFHADYAVFPIARWGAIHSINDNSATIIYNFVVAAVSWGE